MAAKNNDASLVKAALENWQEKEVLKNVQYKLPDIETNPNKIYRNYIKEGLQPDKFKTKEQLFEAVKDALNKTVNGKQVSMGQALKSLFPDGYEGIPLTYSKTGSSKKGNRVIKEVMFDKRAFREQIPLEIKQWFKLNQSKGLIPADSLEKYTKYINKGNTRNAAIAKRLSELTGIKFDKGHIFALFSQGTNDPAAQIAELLSENRGKGGVDNIPKNLADIIDTPKNWQQSAFEFVNRLTGGASGSGLPIDKFGKSLSDGDIASIARHGANPDQVVASKWKKVFDALSEAELAKANNTIPEFVNKFSNRIDESGKYVQKFGSGKPNVTQQVLGVVKKNGENGVNGAKKVINMERILPIATAVSKKVKPVLQFAKPVAKYGIPVAGTVLAASNQRTLAAEYDKNPTTINLARKKIADIQVGLEAADTATLGATGAVTWIPNLIGDASEYVLNKIQTPQTKEEYKKELENNGGFHGTL